MSVSIKEIMKYENDEHFKEMLDKIYAKYCDKVQRNVEGIVININNNVQKYVRMKSGKLVEYSDNDHKGE